MTGTLDNQKLTGYFMFLEFRENILAVLERYLLIFVTVNKQRWRVVL